MKIKTVPIEPTPRMIHAGMKTYQDVRPKNALKPDADTARKIWVAMINAAVEVKPM